MKLMTSTKTLIFLAAMVLSACGGGSSEPDAAVANCTTTGLPCAVGDECCSGFCDPNLEICAREPGSCLAASDPCQVGSECCSFSCVDAVCSDTQCISDNQECTSDGECCSGTCADTCTPLNPSCETSGNACESGAECCSQYCPDGVCSPTPSYCTQSGDTCVSDFECCAGMCAKQEGATLGTCSLVPASGAGSCMTAGEVCGGVYDGGDLPICGGECCSRACFPYGPTNMLICQPPSGCRPTGEICQNDSDCCGAEGNPDGETAQITCAKEPGYPMGRCDNGNACTPAGGICRLQSISCSANANCCAGNVLQFDTCEQDNLGIPRCLVAEIDCEDPSIYEGLPCATSADCCGLPCTPAGSGEFPPLLCGGECVPAGETCTTHADCCAGLPCTVPAGSTMGMCGSEEGCSEYGQSCTVPEDCCNELPCINNICGVIIG